MLLSLLKDFQLDKDKTCLTKLCYGRYKMFHRAKKIPVAEKEKKEKKGKKKDEIVETVETKDDKTDTDMDKGSETGEEEKVEKAEKKKRKIRLDMHLEQIFVDSSDAYVWLYDPIPW